MKVLAKKLGVQLNTLTSCRSAHGSDHDFIFSDYRRSYYRNTHWYSCRLAVVGHRATRKLQLLTLAMNTPAEKYRARIDQALMTEHLTPSIVTRVCRAPILHDATLQLCSTLPKLPDKTLADTSYVLPKLFSFAYPIYIGVLVTCS
jgi:hypothetical protein